MEGRTCATIYMEIKHSLLAVFEASSWLIPLARVIQSGVNIGGRVIRDTCLFLTRNKGVEKLFILNYYLNR